MTEPGEYPAAFDAATEVVRRLGFELARIDASAGIVTTNTVSTAGLATPWMRTEADLSQEIESFLLRDQRRVVITFDPGVHVDEGDTPGGVAGGSGVSPAALDRRYDDRELVCRVEVKKERLSRPGLRLSPDAVRISSVMTLGDSEKDSRAVVVRDAGKDEKLAGLIVERILVRLSQSQELQPPEASAAGRDGFR